MYRKSALLVVAAILVATAVSCGGAKTVAENEFVEDGWTYRTDIMPGAEAFDEYLGLLDGKRVCLLSNQTGLVLKDGSSEGRRNAVASPDLSLYTHVVDTLLKKGVNIVCLMSPEHGFRGTADAGEHVASAVDEITGIPVRSLYGSGMSEEEQMSGFDVMLFDLQDVGARFYTYYVTMVKMMAKCARHNIPFIVLDRPNPVGFYTDGTILDRKYKSGVGGLPIPTIHGMTMGEIARMANGEGWLEFIGTEDWTPDKDLKCDLTVIKCGNYTHADHYKLPVKPSPNLPNMRSIYLYPSICYFEATRVSLGRGTDAPFQIYGAPEMEGGKSAVTKEEYEFTFTPDSTFGAKNPPRKKELCYGVDLRNGLTFAEINEAKIDLSYVIDAYIGSGAEGDKFFTSFFEREIGKLYVREMIIAEVEAVRAGLAAKNGAEPSKAELAAAVDAKAIAAKISGSWQEEVEAFKTLRAPYMLYD